MKLTIITLILFMCFSCNKLNINSENNVQERLTDTEIPINENLQNEVLNVDEILFNGKLKRFFSTKDFEIVFGKADSIILMSDEAPCNYIFENKDGSKNLNDKYYYKNGSRFENTKEKLAVDEFRFSNNNFILYKGKELSSETTITELKKLFPNAIKNIETIDVYNEGKLQVIQLREDENNISDGHIKIFLKNGRLFYIHWWFPC
jgi:hypothetical protein